VVCLIPRLSDGLRPPGELQTPVERWRDLTVTLPDDAPTEWTDVLTGRGVRTHERSVPVGKAFELLPVALLASGNAGAR
ncbi:MAG TPA: hypothetical protein VFH61_03475, partial [Thermoleophilia bacterium]|nr:hypothetical protein [Thermoleophilia bacterium]